MKPDQVFAVWFEEELANTVTNSRDVLLLKAAFLAGWEARETIRPLCRRGPDWSSPAPVEGPRCPHGWTGLACSHLISDGNGAAHCPDCGYVVVAAPVDRPRLSDGRCRGYIEVALHALRDSRVQFAQNQADRDVHIQEYQTICEWLRERGIEVGL